MTTPSITVAIPLHCSARWVDNVAANVRTLPPAVTEIIISDQTCVDGAAEHLRIRLADDSRVTVLASAAGLGFAEHYQMLLEIARGDLFMWMPHDDIFAPDWVPILTAALESHPQAWLSFGRLQWVEIDGATPKSVRSFPFDSGLISGAAVVRMMTTGWAGYAFRGVFRRHEVLAAGLRVGSEPVLTYIDTDWVFAVALHSGLVYDDRAVTWKRAYSGSTQTTPEWRRHHIGSANQAAIALLGRHGPSGWAGLKLRTATRTTFLARQLRRRARAHVAQVVRKFK